MQSEIKPIGASGRVQLSKAVPLDTPFTLYAFATDFCNFKCNYCGHSLGHEKMKEQYDFVPERMTLETFRNVVDQMKEFPRRFKVLSLTGHGEPLTNPELPDMVAYARQADVADRIEFITNASLLTPALADKLVTAGVSCIRISLQGLSGEKYKEVCGFSLDFPTFLRNLTYFYQHKQQCEVYVKIMDIALEKGESQKFYDLFGDISDRMFIEQCRPVYAGVQKTRDMTTSADRYGNRHDPRIVCPLCFYMLGVLPNGDVKPCDAIYKPVILGNVADSTLRQMWRGEALKAFRTQQLLKKRFENKRCAACCAPDDVSFPEDALDADADKILKRL